MNDQPKPDEACNYTYTEPFSVPSGSGLPRGRRIWIDGKLVYDAEKQEASAMAKFDEAIEASKGMYLSSGTDDIAAQKIISKARAYFEALLAGRFVP